MMNIIKIDEEAHSLLEKWRKENQSLIRRCALFDAFYFEKYKVEYVGSDIFFYAENHNRFFEIKASDSIGALFRVKMSPDELGEHDYISQVFPNKNRFGKLSDAEYGAIVPMVKQCMLNSLTVNALLIYGNLIEPCERKISANAITYGNHKIFTIRSYNGYPYAVSTRAHKSPEGVFQVRGHFRRYKNGKVIWVNEFFKGV